MSSIVYLLMMQTVYLIGDLNPIFLLLKILTNTLYKMVVCSFILIDGGEKLNRVVNFIGTVWVTVAVTTILKIFPFYLLAIKSCHFRQRFPVWHTSLE